MKTKILLSVFLFASIFTFAKHVPIEQALKIGKNYYFENVNQVKSMKYENILLSYYQSYNTQKSNDPAFYIFNIEDNNGYVIVSADDAMYPILGYSFKGAFNFEKISPTLALFFNDYATAIDELRHNVVMPRNDVQNKWDELNYSAPIKSVKNIQTVQPLLLAEWNQDVPFNSQCPADAAATSSGGRTYVGCVAVAMGQVMKYYNYPLNGTGSYSHSSFYNGGYGTQTVNFANQTYNWSAMQYALSPSSVNYEEVAKVLFHIGVAVHMQWGPDGSGSQTNLIVSALKTYFKYSTSCAIINKNSYTDASWKTAIIQQLDQNRPVVYSGMPATGAGHAWNCDGYQGTTGNEYFHMNWGWGGYNNGFFKLDSLYAPASASGPAEQFVSSIQAIVNIYPASGYPEYCTNAKTFTTSYGNFDDGSSNQNYQNNNNCQYLIQPTCGKYIAFQFDKFDVDPSDVVTIYDGDNTSAPVLGTILGGQTPGIYNSTGNAMLIKFTTDGSASASGWSANYTVIQCKTGVICNQHSGSFDDGSGPCDYSKSLMNCTWIVDLPDVSAITFNFTSFALAADADYVKIYKNDLSSANMVVLLNSANVPTGTITVPSNKAVVKFFTNSTVNAAGWALNYNSILTDVLQPELKVNELYIYPNPFTNDAKINFDLSTNSNISLSITNLIGQELFSSVKYSNAGSYSYSLKSLVPDITEGIYFINLKTDKSNIVKKVICTK